MDKRINFLKNILLIGSSGYIGYLYPDLRGVLTRVLAVNYVPPVVFAGLKLITTISLKSDMLSYINLSIVYSETIVDIISKCVLLQYYNHILAEIPEDILNLSILCLREYVRTKIYLCYMSNIAKIVAYTLIAVASPYLKKLYIRTDRILQKLCELTDDELSLIITNLLTNRFINIRMDGINILRMGEIDIANVPITENILEGIAPIQIPKLCSNQPAEHFKELNCSICHEEYDETKSLYRILPKCRHSFHCHCIDKWFFSGHNSCPICRTHLLDREVAINHLVNM